MVNLQRYLISKGLDTTDAKDLRRNIRIHLTAASSEDRLPPPNIRKIPYKFIDDPDRSAMDILCDSIRGAMTAEHIPCDTFGSIVKMVLSSDLSDARQKEKRKLETETARAACAKAQIDEEAATIAMAERKVMYNVAKVSLYFFGEYDGWLADALSCRSWRSLRSCNRMGRSWTLTPLFSRTILQQASKRLRRSLRVLHESSRPPRPPHRPPPPSTIPLHLLTRPPRPLHRPQPPSPTPPPPPTIAPHFLTRPPPPSASPPHQTRNRHFCNAATSTSR